MLEVHFSQVNVCLFVWFLAEQADVQEKKCVNVCEADKMETSAEKLMWLLLMSLWLLSRLAQCDRLLCPR